MRTSENSGNTVHLSAQILIAFVSLRHILHEVHEFSHMIVGRLLCGEWGTRDFNNVHPTSEHCVSALPTPSLLGMEGPMTNYLGIWLGAMMIRTAKTNRQVSWGLALVFTTLPVARIITALFGAGDEFGVARSFIPSASAARVLTIFLICSMLFYPLYTAYTALPSRRRALYFLGFLFIPMVLEGAVVLGFFNYLLKLNIMNEIWILGAPKLVLLVLLVAVVSFLMTARKLGSLIR